MARKIMVDYWVNSLMLQMARNPLEVSLSQSALLQMARNPMVDSLVQSVLLQMDRNHLADYLVQSVLLQICLLYTSPSPRDLSTSRMPSSA